MKWWNFFRASNRNRPGQRFQTDPIPEFPVYDQGKKYKAFLFGGHNVTSNSPQAFEMFIASVKRLQATLTGVDVSLTSHPWAVEILERIEKLKTRKPGDPNPFVAPEEFKAFLQ